MIFRFSIPVELCESPNKGRISWFLRVAVFRMSVFAGIDHERIFKATFSSCVPLLQDFHHVPLP